jgi:hypothetical protein
VKEFTDLEDLRPKIAVFSTCDFDSISIAMGVFAAVVKTSSIVAVECARIAPG